MATIGHMYVIEYFDTINNNLDNSVIYLKLNNSNIGENSLALLFIINYYF